MPRRTASDTLTYRKIGIRGSIAGQVDLLLLDPVRRKPSYGAWSKLVNQLLAEWLQKQQNPGAKPDDDT